MAASPSASQLPAAAARGLPSLVLVHGDEPLPMQEAGDAVRAAARAQGFTERTVHVVDRSFRPAQALADAGALSLFGTGRLIAAVNDAALIYAARTASADKAIPARNADQIVDAATERLASRFGKDWEVIIRGAVAKLDTITRR